MSNLQDVRDRLQLILGPMTDGESFITIRCYCGFEGHGRASETWEEHWELVLPQIQYHWKSADGWKQGKPGLSMRFHERTLEEVCNSACKFLDSLPSDRRGRSLWEKNDDV